MFNVSVFCQIMLHSCCLAGWTRHVCAKFCLRAFFSLIVLWSLLIFCTENRMLKHISLLLVNTSLLHPVFYNLNVGAATLPGTLKTSSISVVLVLVPSDMVSPPHSRFHLSQQ